MNRLRDIALIAAFDLKDALRSKKAVGLLVLYLAGALGATGLFIHVLHSMETALAKSLSVSATSGSGAMTSAMFRSKEFLDVVANLIGDRPLAEALVSLPPLALFYGWLSMTFVPLLVTLASCDSISSEVASGSVRFSLFRTDRFSWAMGKLAGESLLMTVGILAGASGTWVLGSIFMSGFEPLGTAWWLLRLSGRAWCYGFAYLGLTMGASQLTRSVNWSRALALMGLFVFSLSGYLLQIDWLVAHVPALADSARQLFPNGHDLDLWRPKFLERLPSLVMLPALGMLYFSAGYWRFSKRDQ